MLRRNRHGHGHGRCRNDFLFPIETQLNKLFDQFFESDGLKDSVKSTQGYPKMDVIEDDNCLQFKLAVPGVKLDDLQIEVEDFLDRVSPHRILTISGKMSEEYASKDDAVFHIRELRHSQFQRVLQIPDLVEGEPEAELHDGILVLKWKIKKEELPPTKKAIPIKTTE